MARGDRGFIITTAILLVAAVVDCRMFRQKVVDLLVVAAAVVLEVVVPVTVPALDPEEPTSGIYNEICLYPVVLI